MLGMTVFDFQREILEYCRSDVDILRRACLKFKNLSWEATNGDDGDGVDAFGSCTIASLCIDVFKTKFLPEEWKVFIEVHVNGDEQWLPERRLDGKSTVYYQGQWIPKRDLGLVIKQELFVSSPIARPPPNGYHSRLNYSKKSIAWLNGFVIAHESRGNTWRFGMLLLLVASITFLERGILSMGTHLLVQRILVE